MFTIIQATNIKNIKNIKKYFISNPLYITTIVFNTIIPINYYNNNINLCYAAIPVCICSILFHHKLNINVRCIDNNIKIIDIFFANFSALYHIYVAYNINSNFALFFYFSTPIIYIIGKYYEHKENIIYGNRLHAIMHCTFYIATIILNYKTYINNKLIN